MSVAPGQDIRREDVDDDLTHWVCCLDGACVDARMPSLTKARAFCGVIPTNQVDNQELEVDCLVCADLEVGLQQTGRCPVRATCCPQFDDICEGGGDA